MIKKVSQSVAAIVTLILVLNPLIAAAATAATGTITPITGENGVEYATDDTDSFTLGDGSNYYYFVFGNFAGTNNGFCYNSSTFSYTGQPCTGAQPTFIDIGGGPTTSTVAQRVTDAINTTTIGITAARNGNIVDLTNDSTGTAGNIPITETVADPLFTVSGMTGGTNDPVAQVPEFSDFAYLSLFIFGGWYFYKRHEQHQQVA